MSIEHIGELQRWVAELLRKANHGERIGLFRVVDIVSRNFGVRTQEVAILSLTRDKRFLRFLMPENLRNIGTIPLSNTNSLAAWTARKNCPEIVNHFASVPHSSVFESVPTADGKPGNPIQKIMSAPITLDNETIGVIQVSRKGDTTDAADFTQPQLQELQIVADAVALCIPFCRS
jgi:GAF domain-containing protein